VQDAKYQAMFDRRIWLWTMALLAGFLPVFFMGLLSTIGGRYLIGVPLMIASLVMTVVFASMLGRRLYAPHVWRVLRRKGYDVCVNCGYWLRGLGEDVKQCPECGAKRERITSQAESTS